jgi:hypothetical protein
VVLVNISSTFMKKVKKEKAPSQSEHQQVGVIDMSTKVYEITLNEAGKKLPPGRYALFALPKEK